MDRNGQRDYEPVDLASWCNGGAEVLDDEPPVGGGLRTFHGLPFLVGASRAPGAAAYVVLEPGAADVVVPVDRHAAHAIVAHRRLPSRGGEPEPAIGNVVGEYGFGLEGRPSVVVPIRERFEVGVISPDTWMVGTPFLAVWAGTAQVLDRNAGRWEDAGLRQTEPPFRAFAGEAFLWSWENPDPDARLASIRLGSRGMRILVAAITIGHASEQPFVRDAAVPVRITMTG